MLLGNDEVLKLEDLIFEDFEALFILGFLGDNVLLDGLHSVLKHLLLLDLIAIDSSRNGAPLIG